MDARPPLCDLRQGCNFTCQSSGKVASGGCCDNVFLPHVEHTNIFGLSQARSPPRIPSKCTNINEHAS
jgi:hypothetical protein